MDVTLNLPSPEGRGLPGEVVVAALQAVRLVVDWVAAEAE